MRLFTIIAVAALFFSSSNTHARAADEWQRLQSKHFILYTNAEEDKARETIVNLEKFRFTIGQLTGLDLSQDYAPPLKLFAFKTKYQYSKKMDEENTAGFYIPQPDGAASVLSLEDGEKIWESKGLQVIFHEYTHHITHQYSPINYPRWYDEGFAEFVSTIEFDGDKIIVGKPAVDRFPTLKSSPHWLKMKEIFKVKGEYVGVVRGRNRISQLYAQGWLITHFIQNSSKYQKALGPFFEGLNQPDVNVNKLFKKTFKTTYAKFDKEVRRYWFDHQLPYSVIDLAGKMPEIDYEFEKLTKTEALIAVDEARLLTGKLNIDKFNWRSRKEDAAKNFETALNEGIRPVEMNLYLARIAMSNDDWENANKYVDQALVLAPKNVSALTMKGQVILGPVGRADRDGALLKKAKRMFAKAIRQDNTHVPALLSYVDIALHKDQIVKASTLKVMESIRFLSPDLSRAKEMEVRLLSKAKKFDDAKDRLRSLISWASSEDSRERYEKMMKELGKVTGNKV